MTGVIEVDLPVLQLYAPHREDQQYWLPSASPKTMAGASWSVYNFESRAIDVVTSRLQIPDKVTLPEAKIEFKALLEFLQDLGCFPDLNGFHTLRTRGQNTAGTSLMCVQDLQSRGRSNRTILEVAEPGERHGLISLRLANLWSFRRPPHISDSTQRLPPFSMTGPLLESQPTVAPLETDIAATTAKVPGESIEANEAIASTRKQRYFLIKIIGELRLQVSIHETPAPSDGNELSLDHLELLGSGLYPDDSSKRGEFWSHWFVCAAVAVYGFQKRQSFYRFLPNQRFLRNAQLFDIKVESAIHFGLADFSAKSRDKRLQYVDNSDLDPLDATDGRGIPQPIQPIDGRHRIWMTKADLENLEGSNGTLEQYRKTQLHSKALMFEEKNNLRLISEKYIAMPNFLRLCLHWLISNPIQLESLSIGSLPEEPWDLHKLAQHTSDLILRMIILDAKFAKEVKSQVDISMNAQVHPLDFPVPRLAKEGNAQDGTMASLPEPSNPEVSGHFCCATILLAIIGQRAAYLLSGQDVKRCENEWPDVYLS